MNKIVPKIALWVIFLGISTQTLAQTNPIANSSWKVKYQIDEIYGDTIKYDAVFRIDPQELSIGDKKKSLTKFNIESVSGDWDQASHIGIVNYDVVFADASGRVTITGEKNMLMIEITLEFDDGITKSTLFAHGIKYD